MKTRVPIASITVERIAEVCHEANRALCQSFRDHSQVRWSDAPEWQRESMIKGVHFRLDNPDASVAAQHEAWMANKIAEGWVYGPAKDAEAKTHPCIVPHRDLPPEQQAKDRIFGAIVFALSTEAS